MKGLGWRFGKALLLTLPILAAGCVEPLFFYAPGRQESLIPAARDLRYEDVVFESADGTSLHGWFIPAKGRPLGTIIHFHGNTKNISGHLRYVEWLPDSGYNVFLFDYRGYGASAGVPFPRGLHEDSMAAINYVRSRPDVDPNRLVIFGQSLGATYALTAVAALPEAGIRAVVVEGAFASHRAIARDKVAGYPLPERAKPALVDLLVGRQYDADMAVSRLRGIPLLLIHGTADDVVPFHHAEELFAAATGPKVLWSVPGGKHLDTFVYRPVPYRQRLLAYLAALMPADGTVPRGRHALAGGPMGAFAGRRGN